LVFHEGWVENTGKDAWHKPHQNHYQVN